MSIRKPLPTGKWLCEKYLERGKRIRKYFATKDEAVAFENYVEDETVKNRGSKQCKIIEH